MTKMDNYIRSILNQPSIELNINYVCNLKCRGCNRLLDYHQSKEYNTRIEQVHSFFEEVYQNKINLHHILISGGEPTLHDHVMTIAKLAMDYKRNFYNPCVVFLVSNNCGQAVQSKVNEIRDLGVEIHASNKNGTDDDTKAFYSHHVCPKEVGEVSNADNPYCLKPLECGLQLNYKGYYACHMIALADMYFNLGLACRTYMELLKASELEKQIRIGCEYCGNNSKPMHPKDFKSPSWVEAIKKKS